MVLLYTTSSNLGIFDKLFQFVFKSTQNYIMGGEFSVIMDAKQKGRGGRENVVLCCSKAQK